MFQARMSHFFYWVLLTCFVCSQFRGASADGGKTSSDVRRTVLNGHRLPVIAIAFSPQGNRLTSVSLFGIVKHWDLPGGNHKTWLTTGWVSTAACFSQDGRALAVACDNTNEIRIWDTFDPIPKGAPVSALGKPRLVLKGHANAVSAVAFSLNAEMLASGSGDGVVKLWDTHTGKEIASNKAHRGSVYSVVFSPNGKTVASGGEGGDIALTPTSKGTRKKISGHPATSMISALAFTPDGSLLASSAVDLEKDKNCQLKLWHVETSKLRVDLKLKGTTYLSSLAFAPDGKTLATAGVVHTFQTTGPNSYSYRDLGEVRTWDVKSGKLKKSLISWHSDPFASLVFSPDGKILAAGCGDSTINLWYLDGKESIKYWKRRRLLRQHGSARHLHVWQRLLQKLDTLFGDHRILQVQVAQRLDVLQMRKCLVGYRRVLDIECRQFR